jgi:hypothetical protein
MRLVVHGAMRKSLMQLLIARAFIGGYEVNFFKNHLADEAEHGLGRSIFYDLTDHVALARDRADNGCFMEEPRPPASCPNGHFCFRRELDAKERAG